MIKKMDKVISYLPILIIGYWLFCALFLIHTDFYFRNFELLDNIDTIIVSLSLLHFICRFIVYKIYKRILLIGIVCIICLNLCYKGMNIEIYCFLYLLLILVTLLHAIYTWKMK